MTTPATPAGRASQPAVAAVIFDWGGTITPWHTVDIAEQWTVFADAVGHRAEVPVDLHEVIGAAEGEAWRRGRTEGGSARLDEIVESVGLRWGDEHTRAGVAAYREYWEPHTLTHESIRPLWESLRSRGIQVGVLSNTIWDRDYHRGLFARDGVLDLIDVDVYSSETPWVKPQAEIFEHAVALLGRRPEECVYVGDRYFEDVHGPQQVGMRTVLIPHSDIPVEQQVSTEAVPDAVAHDLMDILGIIDRWNGRTA